MVLQDIFGSSKKKGVPFKYIVEEKKILQALHHPFIINMFAAFQVPVAPPWPV